MKKTRIILLLLGVSACVALRWSFTVLILAGIPLGLVVLAVFVIVKSSRRVVYYGDPNGVASPRMVFSEENGLASVLAQARGVPPPAEQIVTAYMRARTHQLRTETELASGVAAAIQQQRLLEQQQQQRYWQLADHAPASRR